MIESFKKPLTYISLLALALIAAVALMLQGSAPARATDSTVTYYQVRASESISASSWGDVLAYCNAGDSVTGGGPTLNNWSSSSTRISAPRTVGSDPNPSFWEIEVYNGTGSTQTAYADAVCEHQ